MAKRIGLRELVLPAVVATAALAAGGLMGCGGSKQSTLSSIANPVAAAPVPTPTPRPTPTPDPAKIPAWAQGRVFHHIPVRKTDKVFALTFDDGPWPESTRQILQILKENDVKATFFMVGQEVTRRPEIAREVARAGHAVGNHSWSHPSRPRNPVAQIKDTDAALKKAIGYTPTIFRPPYGILKNGMAGQAMREKQAVFIWSADSNDWKRPGSSVIARNIINEASPGGISLMHDGGGNRNQSVAALPVIISTLRDRGYRFVTIPELLKLRYIAPKKPKTIKKKGNNHKAATVTRVHKTN